MTMTDKIMEIIMSNPLTEKIYHENNNCFSSIAANTLMECNNDNVLETSIHMLALQCKLYDVVLNNIAQFGSKELIEKCHEDVNNILEEDNI